ncbi:Gfo/Idh/MocA family oxidoreductase [Synoicihabitans lomoniglobus]|uniref:Gfo/Idh/MocA family oxidoreductase n=1 Tax=Synoicihabitans lomoniglobus TaxID=2909285 RepID=A0AAF0CQ53_9BACT|nr:Gfo/Idh/MocA family oxidoreductase [Opitutaceae bacterium LMO-M01]WED65989.1 Gfo/Idh/MocA family oxidoreductase [Opitutaceae bacterium LMO-M01]
MNSSPLASPAPWSRRGFLKTGLAAGGMVIAAPSIMRGQSSANDINVVLIGMGSQGRVLLDSLLNIPGLNFRAVCDIWELSRRYGVNRLKKAGFDPAGYENIEDLLATEKDIDVAIIATPDFWHAPHTNACLKAGMDVYCEKMMAHTVESARTMVQTMRETGKLLQIGHQRRSNPRYLHALNNIINKAHIPGRITNINGQWNRAVSEDLGWPKRYEMPLETLQRYGFKDMHQFRNWRWFKDLSGGPISDLGAHQIDIFNWFLGTNPKSVMASGGADYYTTHEWYDNVMAVFEYDTAQGPVRAFYQVLTTTSAGGGYFEQFMGDEGSVKISENPTLTKVYREDRAPDWDKWIELNYLRRSAAAPEAKKAATVDVRETAPLVAFDLPVVLDKPLHQPHLENFFGAVRGQNKLTCDAAHAFESEAAIFKVNPAVAARQTLEFTPADFTA